MVPDFRNKICQKTTGVHGGLERAPLEPDRLKLVI